MDISDCVSTDYVEHDVKTPVSKLRGSFDDQDVRVVVVTNGGDFAGVVSQAELLSSHHPPDETATNVARDPPKVQRTEDLRETARLMVENELKLLPVFDGKRFEGVVTAEGLLARVRDNLDALDVSDVYTRDLFAVESENPVGEVLHLLREHRITRIPILDEGEPEGIVSVYDLVDFIVREVDREQGGVHPGFDGHGGSGSAAGYRTHSGYGDRAGEQARLLDLPARDVMSTPVRTTRLHEGLGDAVEVMLDDGISSLVVVDADGTAEGIVTKTDALRALTWTDGDRIPVQIFNVDLLATLTREDVAERIEEIDRKYGAMDVLEVNVIFHEHRERLRGVPLVLATIRLFTDEGMFSGSGEEYGARAAFDAAADVVEKNALRDKDRETALHNRPDSPERREEMERLLGWWVESID
ncbi:signal transduction protein [Halobacteriales archaeon QS_8_69_26]|nr:MAG: signal transduction protein [Halobacteriales archaeon QS_8_69_26]